MSKEVLAYFLSSCFKRYLQVLLTDPVCLPVTAYRYPMTPVNYNQLQELTSEKPVTIT